MQAEKDVIEFRQQLQQVFRQLVGPHFGDEAGGLAAALPPVRNRCQRIELERVAEHRKEQFVIALQHHLAARRWRQPKRCTGGSGRGAGQFIGAPGEFDRGQVGRVDALGAGRRLKRILELIGEAERDQI